MRPCARTNSRSKTNARPTMALFPISSDKEKQLLVRMQALGVREQDIDEQFVRSSGAGGQNVNKVSSCVVLHHRPSGIRVKCQKERSQGLNRFLARRLLLDKIEATHRQDPPAKKKALAPRQAAPARRQTSPGGEKVFARRRPPRPPRRLKSSPHSQEFHDIFDFLRRLLRQ